MAATRSVVLAVALAALATAAALARESKSDLQKDLNDASIVGDWIYDDVDAGFAKAAKDHRPVCVVFR